jgi:translation initiation factor 1 (eIF-1/SUI1)
MTINHVACQNLEREKRKEEKKRGTRELLKVSRTRKNKRKTFCVCVGLSHMNEI